MPHENANWDMPLSEGSTREKDKGQVTRVVDFVALTVALRSSCSSSALSPTWIPKMSDLFRHACGNEQCRKGETRTISPLCIVATWCFSSIPPTKTASSPDLMRYIELMFDWATLSPYQKTKKINIIDHAPALRRASKEPELRMHKTTCTYTPRTWIRIDVVDFIPAS